MLYLLLFQIIARSRCLPATRADGHSETEVVAERMGGVGSAMRPWAGGLMSAVASAPPIEVRVWRGDFSPPAVEEVGVAGEPAVGGARPSPGFRGPSAKHKTGALLLS
jgi:hypothetical protein